MFYQSKTNKIRGFEENDYFTITAGKDNTGKKAHRYFLIYYTKEVPKDMQCGHLCENKWCIEQEHLIWQTSEENKADVTINCRHCDKAIVNPMKDRIVKIAAKVKIESERKKKNRKTKREEKDKKKTNKRQKK